MMPRVTLVAVIAAPLLAGCATLANGPYQPVYIAADPPAATCALDAAPIILPAYVPLPRKANHVLECRAIGYATTTVKIVGAESAYQFGNIFFGIIPGMIVDGATGAGGVFPDRVVAVLHQQNIEEATKK